MLRRRSTVALAAIGALSSLPAHALDGGGAKQVIDKFLATQGDAQGSAQAAQHVVADINADGKPDIVLMWNYLGPRSLSDLISRVRRRRFSRRARRTTQPIARLSASRPTPPCAKSA
ncbi:MAG: hypothetical protein IT531_21115, partial [Burkholderiales bacterium]|nr:hypothetical protein [Burkholderiales bacterium]